MSFNCSPLVAQSLPLLLFNFEENFDRRISFVDLINVRMYTFVNLTAGDNMTQLQCVVLGTASNSVVLFVNLNGTYMNHQVIEDALTSVHLD